MTADESHGSVIFLPLIKKMKKKGEYNLSSLLLGHAILLGEAEMGRDQSVLGHTLEAQTLTSLAPGFNGFWHGVNYILTDIQE